MDTQTQHPPPTWAILTREEKCTYIVKFGGPHSLTFVVGKQKRIFECHKWVLAIVSSVFEKDLQSPNNIWYYLDDVDPDHFLYFLDFVYYHNKEKLSSYSVKVLASLWSLARKYKVSTLEKAAIDVYETSSTKFFDALTAFSGENLRIFRNLNAKRRSKIITRRFATILQDKEGQLEKKQTQNSDLI